ncbi:uncharacterized protein RCC_02436 [Ramularia collo-cygni]|uniref:C2H2-type domain-containing protein n=1 Tax=Ramularia collo-cygni TaxID=112498 RepID=A0A2D3UMJ9_9PEZI|nr:uncharacterized protein RCC_02436 [Ramularia collo-cygni]CZT16602.1 uncharacterized protein RCC_02436 [Ramularia collo-cygni]
MNYCPGRATQFAYPTQRQVSGNPHELQYLQVGPQTGSLQNFTAFECDTELRCSDHGCNGRTFSSWHNYQRHVQEKRGAFITECPFCGLVFSRKSNRDSHISYRRCKGLKALSQEDGYLLGDVHGLGVPGERNG